MKLLELFNTKDLADATKNDILSEIKKECQASITKVWRRHYHLALQQKSLQDQLAKIGGEIIKNDELISKISEGDFSSFEKIVWDNFKTE
jgi:hypothetical protein